MVVFAKVKYLITLADTFYFFWLQVMGNYLVYVRENRSFAGSSDLQLLRLHGNINNHFVYFFYTLPENFRRLLKKKLNSMRVFIGQAALTFCSPSLSYSRGVGGGGELLGSLGGGVPPGSSNPDPISNQKYHFHTSFQTWPLKSIPILRPAFKKLCHHY